MRELWIRVSALAHKELLHMLRDQQVIYMALGMPVVLVLVFGFAVSFDVNDVRLAVIDRNQSAASRELIRAMETADAFTVSAVLENEDDAELLFRKNEAKAALIIPADYTTSLARGEEARFQVLIDGADGTSARIVLAFANAIGQARMVDLVESTVAARLPIEARVRTWFNPEMKSAFFVVPGLAAVVLSILAVLLSALTVAREWERGSMEQLFATPVGRLPVVLGKLLPYIVLGLVQLLLVLAAGAWLFDVPARGSLLVVFGAGVMFLFCVLSQGLIISMTTKNQQLATQIGALSAILPSMLLSGFMFPISNMPVVLQAVSSIIPARYMIAVLRGVLLEGRGALDLWSEILRLFLLALVMVGVATIKFQRRLDA
jgi:ABC-2 type transport system permease protein